MSNERIWRGGFSLDEITARIANTSIDHMGITFTELGDDYLRAQMPVDARHCQPMRLLNGGVSVLLAESVGSSAASGVIDLTRYLCVGQEVNANHLRPVREGSSVIATARPIHLGARSHVWGIEIHTPRKQLVCISRLTMAVLNR